MAKPKFKKEFSPETWMLLSYRSSEAFGNLEDAILAYQFEMLLKGINKPYDEWLKIQMAQVDTVNKGILGIIKKGRPEVQELIKSSFDEATDIARDKLQEVNPYEKPINISNSEAVETRLGLVDENFKLLALNHTRVTASLPAKIYAEMKTTEGGGETWTMESHMDRFHKAIETAYKRELPNMTSVTYSNGRQVSFKSYAEMAIRTEINNVAVDMMSEGCKGLGVVLFLASYIGNSAPDHAPYQGKLYILEDWKELIPQDQQEKYQKLIDQRDIKTLEWVKETGTYVAENGKTYPIHLGTRPNCRHTFTPVTYEQAVNSNQTANQLGLKAKGAYDKDKYVNMQKQRTLERKVRQLKLDYNNKISEVKASPNQKDAMMLSAQADALKKDIRNAQSEIRDLIAKYPYLDREYSRENPMQMISSLGVK